MLVLGVGGLSWFGLTNSSRRNGAAIMTIMRYISVERGFLFICGFHVVQWTGRCTPNYFLRSRSVVSRESFDRLLSIPASSTLDFERSTQFPHCP